MSGMDMLDMVPSDKERILSLEKELESLKRRAKFLEEDVVYWKNRTEVLDKYCKSVRKFYSDDAIERVVEDGHITKDEPVVTQDKVENQEEQSPVEASADTEDYKLIAEKAKVENAVLREEIERLHATIRAFSTSSLPAPDSPTISPWNKKPGIPDYARYSGPIKLTRG